MAAVRAADSFTITPWPGDEVARWSVWVGGGEVNDVLLGRAAADDLAARYRADGFDDVAVTS